LGQFIPILPNQQVRATPGKQQGQLTGQDLRPPTPARGKPYFEFDKMLEKVKKSNIPRGEGNIGLCIYIMKIISKIT
jgi:hypothetical protein